MNSVASPSRPGPPWVSRSATVRSPRPARTRASSPWASWAPAAGGVCWVRAPSASPAGASRRACPGNDLCGVPAPPL
eukprot:15483620-Alexandrium_andersonii.AAC.1